jgi:hypothetical protein
MAALNELTERKNRTELTDDPNAKLISLGQRCAKATGRPLPT